MDEDLIQAQDLLNSLDISHRLMENWSARELKKYHITVAQAQVLAVIGNAGHSSQESIANTLHTAKTSVRDSLKKLIQHGYIVRTPDKNDKRIHQLALTDEGKKLIPVFQELLSRCNERALKSLTPYEKITLLGLLDKLRMQCTLEFRYPGKRKNPV